ncbi:LysE family translocator [Micromonospora cathayae]|uniref:LysE family translocator n=1 Tax=Micromonospora cathayae TaxID=3028804 RepID=A0ABY7ZLD4_9ACTN|nr:LysE family translocator [Micromonospora sp. HUAS 3]WDZ83715.1 LysE family translocator [Micromonospora sp. HUAS 3]
MIVSGAFLLSSLLVIASPGPDSALVVHRVVRAGRRAPAYLTMAGILTAGTLHATLAVVGVAELLDRHPEQLTALRWAGALGLFGWGAVILVASVRTRAAAPTTAPARPRLHPYWQGVLCTGTNPKVGVFLLAFLPQFVPAGVPPDRAMTVLAAVYLSLAAVWLVTLTETTHRLRRRVDRPGLLRAVELVTGVLFMGFAVRMALVS